MLNFIEFDYKAICKITRDDKVTFNTGLGRRREQGLQGSVDIRSHHNRIRINQDGRSCLCLERKLEWSPWRCHNIPVGILKGDSLRGWFIRIRPLCTDLCNNKQVEACYV